MYTRRDKKERFLNQSACKDTNTKAYITSNTEQKNIYINLKYILKNKFPHFVQ